MKSTKRRDTLPGTPSSIRALRASEVRGKAIQTTFTPSEEAPSKEVQESRPVDEDERITLPVPHADKVGSPPTVPPAARRTDPRREEE